MKQKYLILFPLFCTSLMVRSQVDKSDFQYLITENIEFSALKSFFCLVCQEYVVLDRSDVPKGRGGNNFYGKAYTIGVLDEDTKLWFPSLIMSPWEIDITYDKKNSPGFKPKATIFQYKRYADTTYFKSNLQAVVTKGLLSLYPVGKKGIPIDRSRQNEGTLIYFYSSKSFPDTFEEIKQSIIFLDDINWGADGLAKIGEIGLGKEQKIGGVLFSRYITPGKVEWKLAGMYLLYGNEWLLKSIVNK